MAGPGRTHQGGLINLVSFLPSHGYKIRGVRSVELWAGSAAADAGVRLQPPENPVKKPCDN